MVERIGEDGRPRDAGLSRRDALMRMAVAAGALGIVPGLAACRTDESEGGDAAGAAGATGAPSGEAAAASTGQAAGPLAALGVQLYTLRGEMERDVGATLERVAAIGYREVEFAGYFGQGPAEIRGLLAAAGLRAPAAHLPVEALRDDPDPILESAATIGHEWVIVAWVPEDMRGTLDDWRRTADLFDRIGERAAAAGLRFGYHNHDFEIPPMEGRMPLDVLLESTDPDRVDLELDLFWITHGGGDPIAFMERWPGRVRLVHVKDRTADGDMVDVGAGVIDFGAIFARRARAGIRHAFVEHDMPGDPWASVTASFRHLSALSVG